MLVLFFTYLELPGRDASLAIVNLFFFWKGVNAKKNMHLELFTLRRNLKFCYYMKLRRPHIKKKRTLHKTSFRGCGGRRHAFDEGKKVILVSIMVRNQDNSILLHPFCKEHK